MKKIKLEIVALSHSVAQTQSYAVVLGEQSGGQRRRRLPIVIGAFEAQAIAVAIEKIQPTRPLTHDLIKNIFGMVDVELREIVIDNLQEGIFYSKLICKTGGREIEIDSRTSDALALAVRFNCPIYTYEFILEAAGIILEEEEGEEAGDMVSAEGESPETVSEPVTNSNLSDFTIKELNTKLQEVLDKEDYEKAIMIRDEIDKRKRESS